MTSAPAAASPLAPATPPPICALSQPAEQQLWFAQVDVPLAACYALGGESVALDDVMAQSLLPAGKRAVLERVRDIPAGSVRVTARMAHTMAAGGAGRAIVAIGAPIAGVVGGQLHVHPRLFDLAVAPLIAGAAARRAQTLDGARARWATFVRWGNLDTPACAVNAAAAGPDSSPYTHSALRPWQRAAVDWMVRREQTTFVNDMYIPLADCIKRRYWAWADPRERRPLLLRDTRETGGVLADPPGSGKRVASLALVAATLSEGPTLVVCADAAACAKWNAEIALWLPDVVQGTDVVVTDTPDVAVAVAAALSAPFHRVIFDGRAALLRHPDACPRVPARTRWLLCDRPWTEQGELCVLAAAALRMPPGGGGVCAAHAGMVTLRHHPDAFHRPAPSTRATSVHPTT